MHVLHLCTGTGQQLLLAQRALRLGRENKRKSLGQGGSQDTAWEKSSERLMCIIKKKTIINDPCCWWPPQTAARTQNPGGQFGTGGLNSGFGSKSPGESL